MKLFTKALAGVAVAAALVTSAQASAITVQGVTWDPDSTPPAGAQDFQSTSNLYQWYQTAAAYNPAGPVATFATPLSLVNTYVTGAGLFATMNGVDSATSLPDTTPAAFINNGQLTYTFGGVKIIGASVTGPLVSYTFDLTESYFNVYSNNVANNYLQNGLLAAQVNADDTSYATPFLTGVIDQFDVSAFLLNFNAATGLGNLFGGSSGLISVTGGAAFTNFDTNTLIDPADGSLSDLSFTGSSQINIGSQIATVGTLNLAGNSVPEPESLALVGLGLLGLAYSRRRKINS